MKRLLAGLAALSLLVLASGAFADVAPLPDAGVVDAGTSNDAGTTTGDGGAHATATGGCSCQESAGGIALSGVGVVAMLLAIRRRRAGS